MLRVVDLSSSGLHVAVNRGFLTVSSITVAFSDGV